MAEWIPPRNWTRITTLDLHTAGEPLRIITSGIPEIPGDSLLEKRRYLKENLDHIRTSLMWEPRGHADMYGCILTPPVTEDGDVGVLFLHNEGYSTMCGHGIIGLVKAGLECGLISRKNKGSPLLIDTPAGRVTATARWVGEHVHEVSFKNVPSFLLDSACEVQVQGLGRISFDLAYGGAFYAYVDASGLGLQLTPEAVPQLIDTGMRIKRAVAGSYPIVHPSGDPDLNFLYGTIFSGPSDLNHHSRQVCVFAEGEVDRSPTGTGVSGRAAILHSRGELGIGKRIRIESVIGTCFDVEIADTVKVGGLTGVIPEVSGAAYITGKSEFLFETGDPLKLGFLLRR